MKRVLALTAALLLIGCDDGYDNQIRDIPAPEDSVAVEGKSDKDQAPDSTPSGRPIPAQACESSLSVNGIAAVEGGVNLDVDRIPSQLAIELVDCPHPTAEVRGNFVATGRGSGELHIVVLKRGALPREFNRLGSSRVQLGNERPSTEGGRVIRTDSSTGIIKWITRPGGFPLPVGVATTAVKANTTVVARTSAGEPGDNFRVEIQFRMYDSDGGGRSLTLREKCSAEAQASPSRFDC